MLTIAIAAEFSLAEKIIEILEQSSLDIQNITAVEIYPFDEEQGLRFKNKAVAQIPVDEVEWSEFSYVFFAGDISKANHLAQAADSGCIVIDMLGICAEISGVPVVVPSINENSLIDLRQRNIVSLPDPQVTQSALAINKIIQNMPVKQLMITSLLPASYAGNETVSQLAGQTAKLLNGIPLDDDQQRLAFDVFPKQTTNLNTQLQKIFPQLENILFHQIQVPVFYGLGQLITLQTDYEINMEELVSTWLSNNFIHYHEEKILTPVTNGEAENSEDEPKLHISGLSAVENGTEFWTVADEQRFNLALMAVKLAELI